MTAPVLPPDPNVEGWHWLRYEDADLQGVFEWGPKVQRWLPAELIHAVPGVAPQDAADFGWSYLRPCPSPAELDAMEQTIAELRAEAADLQTFVAQTVDDAERLLDQRDTLAAEVKRLKEGTGT